MAQQLLRAAIGAVLGWAAAVAVLFWLGIVPRNPLLMDALLVAVVVLSMAVTVLLAPAPRARPMPPPDRAPPPLRQPHHDQAYHDQAHHDRHSHQQRTAASSARRPDGVFRAGPEGWPGTSLPAFSTPPALPTNGAEPPLGPPEPGPSTVLLIDVATRTGWEQTASEGREPKPGATDLASQPGGSRIVQCPNCGAFDVDTDPAGREFRFACARCSHSWGWAAGRAWPPTVVRPNRTTRGGVPGRRPR